MNQISFKELKNWEKEGKLFDLVDVREPTEHQDYNIGGRLIPLDEIMQHLDTFKQQQQPTIFYCRKGIRSQIAIQKLSRKIKTDHLYNLQGGIMK